MPVARFKVGVPEPSSNPLKISAPFNSGRIAVTSASRSNRPLSTHCIAAIDVINLVEDAYQNTASGEYGSALVPSSWKAPPKAFS